MKNPSLPGGCPEPKQPIQGGGAAGSVHATSSSSPRDAAIAKPQRGFTGVTGLMDAIEQMRDEHDGNDALPI